MSPERLCGLIFDAAGRPEGARVDDRGRVMLVSRAMKDIEGELTLYRGAQARRGFALRAARQVEVFRQAGMGPEDVRACAERERGSLARKLEDVAAILAAYERELAGRFEDGEGELTLAAERAAQAAFLREARVWFYGFDMMPPTLHLLIAAVAEMGEATTLLPLEMNAQARDGDIFRPLRASAMRLAEKARERNVRVVWAEAGSGDDAPEELRFLSTELFSSPARGWMETPGRVQLFEARSPPRRGALCRGADAAAGARARLALPATCGCWCPRWTPTANPCARRSPPAACPCSWPRAAPARGGRCANACSRPCRCSRAGRGEEDLHACLASGCLDVSRRDAARLRNYAVAYGLRASAFFQPLKRGPAELIEGAGTGARICHGSACFPARTPARREGPARAIGGRVRLPHRHPRLRAQPCAPAGAV